MCGFLSVFSKNSFSTFDLRRISNASEYLRNRGPDDYSCYEDEYYVSHFYRLSIQDPTIGARQPYITRSGNYCISFNGEIYDFGKYQTSKTSEFHSDTSFLAKLLDLYGYSVIEEIRGMFAIAIYNRAKKELFVCRDSCGMKPLYYNHHNNRIILSSMIEPIIKLLPTATLNKNQVNRFLLYGVSSDTVETFFNSIFRVLPGESLLIRHNGSITRYRHESHCHDIQSLKCLPINADEHLHVFNTNVKAHLISDVPIATTISGGVDSSLISYTAASHASIRAYTLKSNLFASEIDKSDISEQTKIDLEVLDVSNSDLISTIKKCVESLCMPFANSSWIYQFLFFGYLSSNTHYKVILMGEGADEIYSGYKRMLFPHLYAFSHDKYASLSQFSDFLGVDHEKASNLYNSFLEGHSRITDYEDLTAQQFLSNTKDIRNERYFSLPDSNEEKGNVYYKKILINYLTRADLPNTLQVLDSLSMQNGIEVRLPFVDFSLHQYILNSDCSRHFQNGFNKFELRRMAAILPAKFRWNKVKSQRPSSLGAIMSSILPHFISLLDKGSIYFDAKSVAELLKEHAYGKIPMALSMGSLFRLYTFCVFNEYYGNI